MSANEATGAVSEASRPAIGSKGSLLVANKRGNTLSKIDLATGQERLRKNSCKNPHELAVNPGGQVVALACYGGTTVNIFRNSDLQLIQQIELGKNARPHGIVWYPNDRIYVTAEGRGSIFRIDGLLTNTPELTEFKTGKEGSHMLAVSPDENAARTTDLGSKTVTRIDLSGDRPLPLHVTVGVEPEGIALTPDGKTLWISARGSNKAYALDPDTLEIRRELDTGAFPLRLAIRPQGDFAVTSDLADGGLTVIDLGEGEVVRQIAVSSAAEAEKRQQVTILWSEDGKRIYAAETGSDTVAEVDFASGKVLRRLKTGKGGDGLAILD
ncbi:MAG: YncE family protein [Marinomonas sp.]